MGSGCGPGEGVRLGSWEGGQAVIPVEVVRLGPREGVRLGPWGMGLG